MDRAAQHLYDSNMSPGPGQRIQTYNLFGEQDDLPDVIHCETIEARSRLHDWEFAPHRHARLHQILVVQDGDGWAQIEESRHPLAPMVAVNVPIGVVHGFSFRPGTRGLVVTFAAEMLEAGLRPDEGVRATLARPAVFAAGTEVPATMRAIAAGFAGRDFARAQILRSLAGLLLGQAARALTQAATPEPAAAHETLARFQALVEAHYLEHWSVSDYARHLSLSATHLSRLVRAATGRPASGLIEERLIREARRNLVFTNLPVSTIAYALGFEDPAYFSRVFSRATGHAPRVFRQRLGAMVEGA